MNTPRSAASIRARLTRLAHERGQQTELLLTRYAVERLLYRLSISPHRDRFVLKGALLFDLWFDQGQRPTRDADLLGHGDADPEALKSVFREIAAIPVEDGMAFDIETLAVEDIRQQANYPGSRITLVAHLAGARLRVQVDVGFGDVMSITDLEAEYPSLIEDVPAPRLRVYPKESVLAEKLHILSTLGIANSRMKDYYDLWVLSLRATFDFAETARAVAATFSRRETPLPERIPTGLTAEFSEDAQKQAQWAAFLRRTGLEAPALADVVKQIAKLSVPLLLTGSDDTTEKHWPEGGPWAS